MAINLITSYLQAVRYWSIGQGVTIIPDKISHRLWLLDPGLTLYKIYTNFFLLAGRVSPPTYHYVHFTFKKFQ